MRQTQRAPRSCKQCSSRKIKCDKAIPCQPCSKRGQASTCTREIVLVRGVMTVAGDQNHKREIQDLMDENRRLRAILSRTGMSFSATIAAQPGLNATESGLSPSQLSTDEMINYPTKLMTLVFPNQFQSLVQTWEDIFLPNRAQSVQLIQHGKVWTAWIHCAVYYPEFESSHEQFWDLMDGNARLRDRDPSWLAVYFGLLAVSVLTSEEKVMDATIMPRKDLNWLMHNWYSASLFCLEVANYTRSTSLMHVKAIAILQMCSNAVGDIVFRNRMMHIGVQIANDLNLPYSIDGTHTLIEAEYSRRLWWVFVICEWFNPAPHRGCISSDDFEMIFPLPHTDAKLGSGQISPESPQDLISPWWYHVILSRAASVYYSFICSLRKRLSDLEELVRTADEGLANIIEDLPPHLQPLEQQNPHVEPEPRTEKIPWINWQRVDLITNLLLLRSKINYECRQYWTSSTPTCMHRRILCLESAKSVIMVMYCADIPMHQRRFMTYTLRLYSAGLILAAEIPRSENGDEKVGLLNSLLKCIQLLENSKYLNIVAGKAVEHLTTFISDISA